MRQMANKYVATILNRIYLGGDDFLYYPSHTVIGEIDPKSRILKDRNGDEFLSITDPTLLMSEVTCGYANVEQLRELPRLMGRENLKDAISDYSDYCKRLLFYVSRLPNHKILSYMINYHDIREHYKKSIELIEKNGGFEKVSERKEGIPNPERQKVPEKREEQREEDEEDPISKAILQEEVRSEIAAFFMEVMEGVYSLEELKQIRKNVILQKEDIESLLDSINLQIEASENGESSIKLKGEGDTPTRLEQKAREQKYPKPRVEGYIDIDDLYNKITRTLIAQDEPTKRVLTEIIRKIRSKESNRRGILITGSTGVGKTKMMELIAKYMGVPFHKIDSTKLTIPGYVGTDIEEELWKLYVKCGKDKKKAEHAIIYFDEIDKKGSSKKEDISGRGVLNVLLPFIEGATYDATENMKYQKETVQIDTSNMIVILGGAFTDVYKDLAEKNSIGFLRDQKSTNKSREATTEDFVKKANMPDEFMGRVLIVKLNDLDVAAIKRLLLESDESAIKVQQRLFEELGVRLTTGAGYLDAIATKAVAKKTGARGLNTVVDETTWEAYRDAYTHLGEYEEIILGEETVEDPKVYQKIPRKRK